MSTLPDCRPRRVSFLLFRGTEAGEHPDLHREGLHPGEQGVVVLPGQQGGGGQKGALLAAHHALEGRAQATSVLPTPTSPQSRRSIG